MHRISWTLLTALIAVLVYLAWSALSPAEAATLTVNTTEFTDDGVCDALPTGDCTLREAILLAGSGDTIAFNIPAASDPGCNAGTGVCVIKPTTTVPVITDPGVTIDGYTQPGASRNTLTSGSDAAIKIEVDMSLAASVSAFRVDAADVKITGFAVSHLSNGSSAVKLEDDGDDAVVQGNFLGLDASGTQADNVLNTSHGILIDAAASSALIGGPSPGDRNVFGGTQDGVWVVGGGGHTIQNNYFGSNAAGTSLLQHSQAIYLAGSGANVVTGNHISSDGTGVLVSSDGNTISGNVFGLGADGVTRLGNTTAIDILGSDNMIGGLTAPEGNLIGGINYNGISVRGGDGNQVAANVIGLNAVGGVSGGEYGLVVDAGTDTLIGGGQFAARNVISGNDVGVYVAPNADSVTIRRNYIGTDYAGGSAVPNRIGVLVQNLSPGSIGTTPRVLVDLNVISGNTDDGVAVTGGAALTVVQRNWIGVNRQLDTAIPNGKNGVVGHADGTVIGGPTGLVGNVIGFNGEDGVRIPLLYDPFDRGPSGGLPSPFTGNVTALKNSIFSNGGLGIDIAADGPHANDAGDGDGGPNGQQNAPVLTAAVVGSTIITGTLDSAPNRDFRLELFTSNNCDASGFGEGGLYAGQTTLHTDGDGQIEFFVASPADAQVGDFVTATVTDLTSGATSEFSNCVTVVAAGSPTPTPTGQTPTPTPIVVETPEPSAEVTDEPTPTPSPTPTPTPTPTTTAGPTVSPTATTASQTPSPEPTGSDILRMGDNECSGDVSARDPLWTLLSLAGLGRDGFGDCPEVGDDFGAIWGDVNCDGLLDGDDVVGVLLWLSGRSVPQEAGCPEIGEEINF